MLQAPAERHNWKHFQKNAAKANAALVAMSDAVTNSGLEHDLIEPCQNPRVTDQRLRLLHSDAHRRRPQDERVAKTS